MAASPARALQSLGRSCGSPSFCAGVACAWVVQTVRLKWIADQEHPATILSTERMDFVPALPGLLTLYHADFWWNGTLADTLPEWTLDPGSVVLNPRTPLPKWNPPQSSAT